MKSISLIMAFAASAAVAAPTPQSSWWSWEAPDGGDNSVAEFEPPANWWPGSGNSGDDNNNTPTSSAPAGYGTGSSSVTPTSSSSAAPTSSGSANTTSGSLPGPVVNDYPQKYQNNCGEVDQWSLTACQCVSFVAWRISSRINDDFSRAFDGETWSNANTWANAAADAGVVVNNTPAPGAIAQTDAGSFGHVAWVASVDGDNVRLEEYNALNPLGYDTRVVSASQFQYIHIPVASS